MILLVTAISLSLVTLGLTSDIDASVTIDQYPAYSLQRECGKGCIQDNYGYGADIEGDLGCTWNGCYCGTQYQAAATSILKSCWSAYCGTSSLTMLSYDIATALSIYSAYCGDVVGGEQASTTTVPNTGVQPSITTVFNTYTQASMTTVTVSMSASSGSTDTADKQSNARFSTADRIALGVGLGLGIPTLIATVWMCCWQMNRH